MLGLEQYRSLLTLDQPFVPSSAVVATRPELVRQLVEQLIDETAAPAGVDAKRLAGMEHVEEQRRALRARLTTRGGGPLPERFHSAMDVLLQVERRTRGTTDVRSLSRTKRGVALWQGDITTLAADAIVNAANEQLQGCFQPFH